MNQPEIVFRIGHVSASVFMNKIQSEGKPDRFVRSVSLQKRYVTEKGEAKFNSSFGLGELLHAIEVLRLAFCHVADEEAKVVYHD